MAGDEETVYVHYGTPLVSEEDLNSRKRKAALDQGQARRVAPWKQEVTDSEGRRRFHGAFSGGFSAGYFNTVGSKEGWEPQTFTSSRKSRADKKEQSAYDFMDEDEKAEIDSKDLGVLPEFDTFGSTAAELARRQAAKEIGDRPSTIPGPLIDEIIVPANESIGVKLLLKMGWRHGRQIGTKHIAATSGARREARKAMMALAQDNQGGHLPSGLHQESVEAKEEEEEDEIEVQVPESTPSYVLNPKNDLYGLGFDPFKNAPEFRGRRHAREGETAQASHGWKRHSLALKKPSLFRPNAGKMGSGFGIGALEDLGEEDEDVYDQGMEFEVQEVDEDDKPALEAKKPRKWLLEDLMHKGSALPGFHLAREPLKKKPWFAPPIVPKDFNPIHKFAGPLHSEKLLQKSTPPEAEPPVDPETCKIIEGLASFVAKSGSRFEEISKVKHAENPRFTFLFGGSGHDYYIRKLWEEQQKLVREGKQQIQIGSRQRENSERKSKFSPLLNAEERGKLLGETSLPRETVPRERENVPVASLVGADDRARLQSALSSTFTKSSAMAGGVDRESQQPFKHDPVKQTRFEQFMTDKSRGGLRKPAGGGSGLSEIQRSQEIFEFEAVARMQQEGLTLPKPPSQSLSGHLAPELAAMMGSRFTSSGVESTTLVLQEIAMSKDIVLTEEAKRYPRREENPWRPSSMLCKRFDLLDPYVGKAPPLPKPRSRTESFILLSNPVERKPEFHRPPSSETSQKSTSLELNVPELTEEVAEPLPVKEEVKVEPIPERPVDLYKAIFSDESDEEGETVSTIHSMQVPESIPRSSNADFKNKSSHAANAALNRLVAGDFLESLGKELGLKVPEQPRLPEVTGPAKQPEDIVLRPRREPVSAPEFKGSSGTSSERRTNAQTKGPDAETRFPMGKMHESPAQALHSRQEPNGALYGVKTRYLDIPDGEGRWGNERKDNWNASSTDAHKSNVVAPLTTANHEDTESEPDSNAGKALAKRIRREERRIKKEKEKEKRRHRHRSSDKQKDKKKEKNREKERHHHHKHKRRHSPYSSATSSST